MIHRDYESSSLSDITSVGAYRYCADPSTRILMFAILEDDSEPVLWDFLNPNSEESREAVRLMRKANEERILTYAHNTQFEIAIDHYRLKQDVGVDPIDHDLIRCTQAMCRRAAIPPSLGEAAKFCNLEQQKASVGDALIDIFSCQHKPTTLYPPEGAIDPDSVKPLKRGGFTKGKKPKNRKSASPILEDEIPWDWQVRVDGQLITVRQAWELFKDYCKQDVRAERELHRKLEPFELTGDELASFQFDMRMNFRGVPVNRDALTKAQALVESFQGVVEARMQRMCGLKSSQGQKLKAWLKERGYPYDDMQADTVEKALANPEGLTPLAQEVLQCRALLSFAALKKIPSMLNAACPDGRVRGTTVWYGARTGRATGRIIQPQNMKKSTIQGSKIAYDLICQGTDLGTLELMWGSPLEVIASCCRHFIQRPEGMLLDADYTGVEARIAPWLGGEKEKLDSILAGLCQYKVMASEIVFNIPYDQVTKEQRTVGKPVELSCVYGTGGEGLMNALRDNHGVHKTEEECDAIVAAYRAKFKNLVQCWHDMERAAITAIRTGKMVEVADGRIAFGRFRRNGMTWMVMRLPSGRKLYYPRPEVKSVFRKYKEKDMVKHPWKREEGGYWSDSISFYGSLEGKWCRISTWGSRLFENACQAIGADLLNYGCLQAEAAGYPIIMIIHDQVLAEDVGLPLDRFKELFCAKQPWAETFPLDATADIAPFYLKDD